MTSELPKWAQGLNGRNAVVTGASRGLGEAIVFALAEAGADVFAVARNEADLKTLAAKHARIHPWVSDVADPAFHAKLAAHDVDILVNNAGTNKPMPMVDVPLDVLDNLLGLNVRSAFLVAQAAVRSMLRRKSGGAIVNITSQMGHIGAAGRVVYCMTKHALEGMTKAMAVELAPQGIRVNSVAPTYIETPLTAPMLADPKFRQSVIDMIPLGRIGEPADVAAAVVYLASPAAKLVTGTSLLVDGGWTAR